MIATVIGESEIDRRRIPFSFTSMFVAGTSIVLWMLLIRFALVFGVFLALTLPFCVAIAKRRALLTNPVFQRLFVRLPVFVVLFLMFYCGILGPLTSLISLTRLQMAGERTEIVTVAVYSPLVVLSRQLPAAREPVAQYLDWWDLSQW